MRLTLEEVITATRGALSAPGSTSSKVSSITVSGVSTDTRTIRSGDLFVPLRGPHADGNDFISEAFRKGASASLATRAPNGIAAGPIIRVEDGLRALADLARFYRQRLAVHVVGITGSVGKTTTTKMTAAALATRLNVLRTKDEWNAEIGVPLTILGLEPGHHAAVVEMAMRGPGQITELVEIAQPQIGVVTNVGDAHLELLGSREKIAKAKEELVLGLPEGGTAILNIDDRLVARMKPASGRKVITYGLNPRAAVRAENIKNDLAGVQFSLWSQGATTSARLRTWGRHNASNAAAAAAVGIALGLDLKDVAHGLESYTPPKMRLEPVQINDVLVINDAYNASPASMDAAFEVMSEVAGDRRAVAILGEMKELGPESPRLHHEVGVSLAGHRPRLLIAVEQGGNQIAQGAAAGGLPADSIVRFPSVSAAIQEVPKLIRSRDVVLVKGSRALEMERIVSALVRARPA